MPAVGAAALQRVHSLGEVPVVAKERGPPVAQHPTALVSWLWFRQERPEQLRRNREKSMETIRNVNQASRPVYPKEERWSNATQDPQNVVVSTHETTHLVPSGSLRAPQIEHSHVILNDRQFLCGVSMEAFVLSYDCPAQPAHLGKPFVVSSVLGEPLVVEHDLDRNAHQPEGFRYPPPDVSVEKQCMGRPPTGHHRNLRPRNEGHPLEPC